MGSDDDASVTEPVQTLQVAPSMLTNIESPFAGNEHASEYQHKVYLQCCLLDSILRGETPVASHQMYTDALDDERPGDRRLGLDLGDALRVSSFKTVVYADFGMSPGMLRGVDKAVTADRTVIARRLFPESMQYPSLEMLNQLRRSLTAAVRTKFTDG